VSLHGSLLPKINARTWEGWEPSDEFVRDFNSWPDQKVPEDIQVWCKGFIPGNATSEVVNGLPTMPIKGPGGMPIPGLLGMCAGIDGRDWSDAPPSSERPLDSRFWAWMEVARGRGAGVNVAANCGMSHNVCCEMNGCWGGHAYGDITCSKHCPDSEMRVERVACWTPEGSTDGKNWSKIGVQCTGGSILAARAYIQGRGGNPCGEVFGVSPPAASWDVGVAVFPTKRKVTITGYVDDAPSYECYARAKDNSVWGPTVTLARLPIRLEKNIAIELMGNSDRPINPSGSYFDLPGSDTQSPLVLV